MVVDGTDNFPTRYLVNDACVLLNKPNVYGSIYRFDGQVSVFNHNEGPCYRCLYPSPPPPNLVPSCAAGGVLGVLPGIIGTMQANEALKLILNIGELMVGRFLLFDAKYSLNPETKISLLMIKNPGISDKLSMLPFIIRQMKRMPQHYYLAVYILCSSFYFLRIHPSKLGLLEKLIYSLSTIKSFEN